jgi:hypothetical protein
MYTRESAAFAKTLKASEFNMFSEMREQVGPAEELNVPQDHVGYVIYGPYWPMAPGRYLIEPVIEASDGDQVLGTLEVCDMGVVLASTVLRKHTVLTAQLMRMVGLEIRIKSAGVPFRLQHVIVAHFPDPESVPSETLEADLQALAAVEIRIGQLDDAGQNLSYNQLETPFPSAERTTYDHLYQLVNGGAAASFARKLTHEVDFGAEFEAWLVKQEAETVLEAWGDKLQQNAPELSAFGFDLSALFLTRSDSYGLGAAYANAEGDDALAGKLRRERARNTTPLQSVWLNSLREVQGYFAKSALSAGYAMVTCPYTGVMVRSSHAIPVSAPNSKQIFLFYRFTSIKTFYIVVSGFSAEKGYLYVPDDKLVVQLASPTFQWGSPETCVKSFRRWVVQYSVEVCEYLSRQTRPCTLIGAINNLGHFFWNEVSGLLTFSDGQFLRAGVVGVSGGYAFVDAYSLLNLPEIGDNLAFNDGQSLFLGTLERSLFCVRPAGCLIDEAMAIRLRERSWEVTSETQRARVVQARRCDFLLWAGLRGHNKVWLNQVEGLVAIIAELNKRYGSVGVYVDGTPDCSEYLAALETQVPADVRIFAGVDVPVSETLVWAFEVDAYVTTIGSGLVLPTWIGSKPGVAHSERDHLHQMSFWGDVRTDAPLPKTPRSEQIHEEGSGSYCNYTIGVDDMLQLFREVLNGHFG